MSHCPTAGSLQSLTLQVLSCEILMPCHNTMAPSAITAAVMMTAKSHHGRPRLCQQQQEQQLSSTRNQGLQSSRGGVTSAAAICLPLLLPTTASAPASASAPATPATSSVFALSQRWQDFVGSCATHKDKHIEHSSSLVTCLSLPLPFYQLVVCMQSVLCVCVCVVGEGQ
jgi:hypothetical protein